MLSRMVEQGALERVSRGLYRLAGRPISEHHGWCSPCPSHLTA